MLLKWKTKLEDEKLSSHGFCPRDSSSDSSLVLNTSFSSPNLHCYGSGPTAHCSNLSKAHNWAQWLEESLLLQLVTSQPCVISPTMANQRSKPWMSLMTTAYMGRGVSKVSSSHTAWGLSRQETAISLTLITGCLLLDY